MGWWGYGITDGDTPCDQRCEYLVDCLGLDEDFYDLEPDELRQEIRNAWRYDGLRTNVLSKVRKHYDWCTKTASRNPDNLELDRLTGCQVAAWIILDAGLIELEGRLDPPSVANNEAASIVSMGLVAARAELEYLVEDEGWSDPNVRVSMLESFVKECAEALS